MFPPRLSLDAYPSDAGDISLTPYQGAGTYMSTGSDVALRNDPRIPGPLGSEAWMSNVKEFVQKGDILDGTAQVVDGFAEVTHRATGAQGWMSTKYLTPSNASDLAIAMPQPGPGLSLPDLQAGQPDVIPVSTNEPQPKKGASAGEVVIGLLLIVAVGYGLAK